jgi:hypothetical protein
LRIDRDDLFGPIQPVKELRARSAGADRSSPAWLARAAAEGCVEAVVTWRAKRRGPPQVAGRQMASRRLNRCRVGPRAMGRCRSAPSQVAVRRGSMTTTFVPRSRGALPPSGADAAPDGTRRGSAHQHHQIGQFQILILPRHGIVPKARRWPATLEAMHSRELVSILAAADEAFHQLVGDVVILGQQLPRDVKRHRIRPVLGDGAAKRAATGQGRVPTPTSAPRSAGSAAARWPQRLAQRVPLTHSRPKLAGWSGSPLTTPPAPSGVARPRSPPRNRGRWCGLPPLPRHAAAMPPTAGQKTSVQQDPPAFDPRGGIGAHRALIRALRLPGCRSNTIHAAGRSPAVPCTIPSDSGPPLCGQRSSSAKTSSSAVRKMAMQPMRGLDHPRALAGDVVQGGDVDQMRSFCGPQGQVGNGVPIGGRVAACSAQGSV